jgi:hypothetical protein
MQYNILSEQLRMEEQELHAFDELLQYGAQCGNQFDYWDRQSSHIPDQTLKELKGGEPRYTGECMEVISPGKRRSNLIKQVTA